VYEQICHLFPFTRFEIFFIGPQAAQPSRPLPPRDRDPNADPKKDGLMFTEKTPLQNSELNKKGLGRVESDSYGVPAYTVPVSSTLTLTSLQTTYETVHEQFAPFDPYTDVFFAFCPGFGFPSPSTPGKTQGEVEWKESIQKVLETKCPLFVTGFSPRDVERDINSLDAVEGVRGEYDILLRPGENGYASLKWEAGDFDPRVMVRVNWGVWGMRGKSYEVEQKIREE
jgi:splicing suppressor protein 51